MEKQVVVEEETWLRKPLPPPGIELSSSKGFEIFQRSIKSSSKRLFTFFPLFEQFHTQAEPTFCGLGTLVVVFNTLLIDSIRAWKGVWRYWDENMLDCCKMLSIVRNKGIEFPVFVCLARCNGAKVTSFSPSMSSVDMFREHILECMTYEESDRKGTLKIMTVSYGRGVLGQSGDGHYSPIGAYDKETDMCLIMDVARFKYPPHWVPIADLFRAMEAIDSSTGLPRGYAIFENPGNELNETYLSLCASASALSTTASTNESSCGDCSVQSCVRHYQEFKMNLKSWIKNNEKIEDDAIFEYLTKVNLPCGISIKEQVFGFKACHALSASGNELEERCSCAEESARRRFELIESQVKQTNLYKKILMAQPELSGVNDVVIPGQDNRKRCRLSFLSNLVAHCLVLFSIPEEVVSELITEDFVENYLKSNKLQIPLRDEVEHLRSQSKSIIQLVGEYHQ